MRSLLPAIVLVASVGSLLGVVERALAALRLTWKFGFQQVEPVYLVPQTFWLFAVLFGALVLGTALISSLWRFTGQSAGVGRQWLRYAQAFQIATACLLVTMFVCGFFSLS